MYARRWTKDAVDTLARLMHDPDVHPADRVSAARAILEYGWGKPPQATVEVQAQAQATSTWEDLLEALYKGHSEPTAEPEEPAAH
jgi:hypothetical protein